MIKVYTCGCFDLFHLSHLRFLQKAKDMGNFLLVGVLPDELMGNFKRKPIIPYEQRLEIIRNIKCVDEVIQGCFTKDLTEDFYKQHGINIHCNGDDVLKGQDPSKYLTSYGMTDYVIPMRLGIMRFIPYDPVTSTTTIIGRVKNL